MRSNIFQSLHNRTLTVLALSILIAGCTTEPDRTGPGTISWRFEADGAIFTAPAVGSDGTIHIATRSRMVYAINPDGSLKWEYTSNKDINSSPVLSDGGGVYMGLKNGSMLSLTSTGAPDFTYSAPAGDFVSAPALGADGTLFYGQGLTIDGIGGGVIFSLDPSYWLNWYKGLSNYSPRFDPVIGSDGTIYMPFGYGLYAHNPSNGNRDWTFMADGEMTSGSPAITGAGIIIFGATDGVYAVTSEGSLLWKYAMSNGNILSPVIGADGTIYFGTWENTIHKHPALFALNPDGTLKWSYSSYSGVSAPVIDSDGMIYWATRGGLLEAITPDGKLDWEFELSRGEWSSSAPAIGSDGTLYIGTSMGQLYAIRTDSEGLADSPWPRFRGNNTANGRRP